MGRVIPTDRASLGCTPVAEGRAYIPGREQIMRNKIYGGSPLIDHLNRRPWWERYAWLSDVGGRYLGTAADGSILYSYINDPDDYTHGYVLIKYVSPASWHLWPWVFPMLKYIPPEIGQFGDADLANLYGIYHENGWPVEPSEVIDYWIVDYELECALRIIEDVFEMDLNL